MIDRVMQSLEEIYNRLKQKKRERKDMMDSARDALHNDASYQELLNEVEEIKIKLKQKKNEVMDEVIDRGKLEELTQDIKTDIELLTDIALSKFVAGEPVEIMDDMNVRLVPEFKVNFKKA